MWRVVIREAQTHRRPGESALIHSQRGVNASGRPTPDTIEGLVLSNFNCRVRYLHLLETRVRSANRRSNTAVQHITLHYTTYFYAYR